MDAAVLGEILERSAVGYGALAAEALLEKHPALAARFAPRAFGAWKTHLTQRVLELASALDAGEPRVFVAGVDWVHRAFSARGTPIGDLRAGLESLRECLEAELPPSGRRLARDYLDLALASLDREPEADEAGLEASEPEGHLGLAYLAAVLEGDVPGAVRVVLDALRGGLAVERAYAGVLMPAQREVGRLWHEGQLSIAEERVVTATTRRTMSLLVHEAPHAAPIGKTVVVAAVAGNAHDIAVRALSDLFEVEGWRAICLGGDVPAPEIARAAQYFGADLLALSAALGTHLKQLEDAIAAVRRTADPGPRILVGGRALAGVPDQWRRLGADGHADDLTSAVAEGYRLVSSPSGR